MTAKPNLTLVTSPRPLPDGHVERNPGIPLDLDVVRAIRVNRSAVERRAATMSTRRTVKKEWHAAWLLRAITLIDLTTLSGDDTPGNVRRLCAKARHPLRDDITSSLGVADLGIKVGAVCVYHSLVRTAVEALDGSGIPVAAVSTGFPAGLSPIDQRVEEIRASVAAGAREIDIVITRAHVLTGNYEALYDEVRRFREACGHAHMKAILATGELATLGNVALEALKLIQYHEFTLREHAGTMQAWNGRTLVPLYHPSPQVIASQRGLETQLAHFGILSMATGKVLRKVR